jgi:hypothetical protein
MFDTDTVVMLLNETAEAFMVEAGADVVRLFIDIELIFESDLVATLILGVSDVRV